jgi:transcription elongation factor Elf1
MAERASNETTGVHTIADKRLRCPRCESESTVQSSTELRLGVEYLTLRCVRCGLVHDAQMPVGDPGKGEKLWL